MAPPSPSAAQSAQASQAGLGAVVAAAMADLFKRLDVNNLRASLPAFTAATKQLVDRYGAASGTLAARFYRQQRSAAGIRGTFTPKIADPPPVEQVKASVDWATRRLWSPEPDLTNTQTDLEGMAEKLTLGVGRETVISSVRSDRRAKAWARVPEPGCCSFCALLAIRGAVYKKDTVGTNVRGPRNARSGVAFEGSGEFKVHDHCVPGSTLVTGPSTEVAYRRWYEGELIVIRTAAGDELSITPNHPVLTLRGWVPAGLLTESDQVVQRSGADLAALQVPHEDDVPARIEDVWRSHSVDGLRAVPVTAEDFHGDIGTRQGDVEVVWADGLLSQMVDALLGQVLTQPIGAGAGSAAVAAAFLALSDLGLVLRTGRMSGNGAVRRSRQRQSVLRFHQSQAQLLSGGSSTRGHAGLSEPASDYSAGYSELLGDGQFRLATRVGGDRCDVDRHPVVRRPLGPGSRFDPAAAQTQPEGLGVHADLGRSLLERLTGGVKLCGVSDLRRVHYSGHVFNLQTAEGWYDANSLVVSNCRCHVEPVFYQYEPSAEIRGWQQIYTESTAGKSNAAARLAFRQAFEGRS